MWMMEEPLQQVLQLLVWSSAPVLAAPLVMQLFVLVPVSCDDSGSNRVDGTV